MTSSIPGAYVRIAEPHEYTEVTWILTRGFARDPCMNNVREVIPDYKDQPDYNSHSASAKRTLENLFVFQNALVQATILCGGFITLAVIPPQKEEHKEIIGAATLWLKPKQQLDFPLSVITKSEAWKILLAWGFTGVRRIHLDCIPVIEKISKKGFKARSADVSDSWYLLEVATDPAYDGKGLCSLLMKDGFERTLPKPIHLEASTSRTRDIYSHYGFEIEEECWFGKGSVDVNGLAAKREAATGYPEWIMIKALITSSCADYLGPYGTENDRYHLYRTQRECIQTSELLNDSETTVVVPFVSEERKLIYVQEAGIDSSIRDDADELALLSSLEDIMTITTSRTQTTFSALDNNNPLDFDIIYRTNSSALLSVSSEMADRIDAYLPRFVVPVLVNTATDIPVSPDSRRRISNWLDNISFKSRVDEIVDTISIDYMRSKLEYLTGESSNSPLRTRYAKSDDAREAATWLKAQFEENGAKCEFHQFRPDYSPNVICRYAASGDSDGIIILGAHYDSRAGPMNPKYVYSSPSNGGRRIDNINIFKSIRAPGANDDGSGIASLLGITHAIKENNLTFTNNIQFAAFSGEEQGLVGSIQYAQKLRDENANVLVMVQADMIGYRRSDENPQIAFPASRGFASTQVFERTGPIADPMYHNSGDLSRREGYDFEQIRSIAKVTFSLVLDTSLSS
ncbi:hypothetical protein Clacol_010329 [Clathrus columnatus]|uniref:Peptide hydrolase n=1 Tax=Clathrus columnatus TaxID=1419009 RepID=A0AAV5ANJ2_9AGAM|nr:hypothetical protein Clacol_010329 [Clathrus columnatus]